jgi:hypothetical protein
MPASVIVAALVGMLVVVGGSVLTKGFRKPLPAQRVWLSMVLLILAIAVGSLFFE